MLCHNERDKYIRKLVKSFDFSYIGGGYFRQKGIPKGTKADTLHGDQVVEAVVLHVISNLPNAKEEDPFK